MMTTPTNLPIGVEAIADRATGNELKPNADGSVNVDQLFAPPVGSTLIFKPIKNVSVTQGTPISAWTPTASKKFRLLGYHLSCTVTCDIMLEDASGSGNEFLRVPRNQSANASWAPSALGVIGYLSTTANNVLCIDVTASGSVQGYVYGLEE